MWIFILFVFIAIAILGTVVTTKSENAHREAMLSMTSNLEKEGFSISKQVIDLSNFYSILVDDTHHQWAVIETFHNNSSIYSYSDLVEYEILQDGDSIIKGRVGSVVVGGLLFGGIGALAGGARAKKVKKVCKSLIINIVVNDLSMPQINIPLISSETRTDSTIYINKMEKAKEFAAVLAIIKEKVEQEKEIELKQRPVPNTTYSVSDEIEKLYSLKEKGIITEEEFNIKKKQLLD